MLGTLFGLFKFFLFFMSRIWRKASATWLFLFGCRDPNFFWGWSLWVFCGLRVLPFGKTSSIRRCIRTCHRNKRERREGGGLHNVKRMDQRIIVYWSNVSQKTKEVLIRPNASAVASFRVLEKPVCCCRLNQKNWTTSCITQSLEYNFPSPFSWLAEFQNKIIIRLFRRNKGQICHPIVFQMVESKSAQMRMVTFSAIKLIGHRPEQTIAISSSRDFLKI